MSDPLSQIRKLRALADKSPYSSEAESAKIQIEKLEKKYNVSEGDIIDINKWWQRELLSLIQEYRIGDYEEMLLREIIDECEKWPSCDDWWYQQGVREGVEGNLIRLFGKIKPDKTEEDYENVIVEDEDEYNKVVDKQVWGQVNGDSVAYNFFNKFGVEPIKKERKPRKKKQEKK